MSNQTDNALQPQRASSSTYLIISSTGASWYQLWKWVAKYMPRTFFFGTLLPRHEPEEKERFPKRAMRKNFPIPYRSPRSSFPVIRTGPPESPSIRKPSSPIPSSMSRIIPAEGSSPLEEKIPVRSSMVRRNNCSASLYQWCPFHNSFECNGIHYELTFLLLVFPTSLLRRGL